MRILLTGATGYLGGKVAERLREMNYELGCVVRSNALPPRQSDQKVFVAETGKIHRAIGWKPEVSALDGVREMIDWIRKM